MSGATYRASFAGGGTTGTTDRTCSVTPAVGDLLVAFVALSTNTNATPTMSDTGTGGTWTLVQQALWNASADNSAVFVRNNLSVSTTAITVTCASGSNAAGEIVVIAVSGMSKAGTSAIRSKGAQANQAASTTPAPVLNQTSLTGNLTMAAVMSGDTTTSPNASWTERQDVSQTIPTTALEVGTRNSGFAGTTITFAATQSTVFASHAIELDTSGVLTAGSGAFVLTGSPAFLVKGTKILNITAARQVFTAGNWPRAQMQAGRYTFSMWMTFASSGTDYSGFKSIFAQIHGALWIVDNALELWTYTGGTDVKVLTQAMTWNAGDMITVVLDTVAKRCTISGALTGNGTFTWATTGLYWDASFDSDQLEIGTYSSSRASSRRSTTPRRRSSRTRPRSR